MPKLKVLKDFHWAHRHVDIKAYAQGEVIQTDDEDLIRVGKQEKWLADAKKEDITAQTAALESELAALGDQLIDAEGDAAAALEAQIGAKRQELQALAAT